jgi:putative ABC transport system permease protein
VLTLAPLVATAVTKLIGSPLARLGGTTAALARRNALRNPRRTANTATALMIGLALVSTVTVVASSMKASVADVIADSSRADFILKAASQASPGLPPQLAEDLRAVDGVDTVSEMRFGPAQVDGRTTFVAAIDPKTVDAAANLEVSSGSTAALDDRSLLVSDKVAEAHGWSVGDPVQITYAQTGVQRFTVAGTFGNTTLIGSDYVVDLAAHVANTGSSLDVAVLVVAADGADLEQVRAGMETVVDAYPIAQLAHRPRHPRRAAGAVRAGGGGGRRARRHRPGAAGGEGRRPAGGRRRLTLSGEIGDVVALEPAAPR